MADRFTAMMSAMKQLSLALFVLVFLFGCEAVKMPDLSQIDFGLKEKPVVTIKAQYNQVNIRPTPSTSQAPIAAVKGGDSLRLITERGDWLNVSFYDTAGNEQNGWVYKYLVNGYNKPANASSSGRVTVYETEPVEEEVPATIEEVPPQIEPATNELPKSEKVSPL